jgi:L-tartrate/succinate antiporter
MNPILASRLGEKVFRYRSIPWRTIGPLLLGAGIWLVPSPEGLTANAWSYFALCAAVIAALITEPLPGPLVGLVGITAAAALHLVAANPEDSIRWALSGFSNGTVWLIFVAFMFGLAYEKTGLGRRIALNLVGALGRRTLGLGYAIALADLILAPFMPSNTARSGGTIFPIIKNIPTLYGSSPGSTARSIGGYVMWTAFAAQSITSSMFLTANAANLVAVALLKENTGITVSWTQWLVGFLPAGLLLFALLPWLVFVVYPPTIKTSAAVTDWAKQEQARIGTVTGKELLMAAIAILALVLWIFASARLSPATVALIALCLMFVSGLITWSDMLEDKDAWKVLVWFGTLLTLAEGLNKVGILKWFANQIACACAGIPVLATLVLFVAVFFISHYMFASLTAHATALYAVFLVAGSAVPGMPARPYALGLCYTLGLMGVLSPYATGPAPIYFGSGFISKKEFWLLGSLFAAIYLSVLLAVEIPYLLLIEK